MNNSYEKYINSLLSFPLKKDNVQKIGKFLLTCIMQQKYILKLLSCKIPLKKIKDLLLLEHHTFDYCKKIQEKQLDAFLYKFNKDEMLVPCTKISNIIYLESSLTEGFIYLNADTINVYAVQENFIISHRSIRSIEICNTACCIYLQNNNVFRFRLTFYDRDFIAKLKESSHKFVFVCKDNNKSTENSHFVVNDILPSPDTTDTRLMNYKTYDKSRKVGVNNSSFVLDDKLIFEYNKTKKSTADLEKNLKSQETIIKKVVIDKEQCNKKDVVDKEQCNKKAVVDKEQCNKKAVDDKEQCNKKVVTDKEQCNKKVVTDKEQCNKKDVIIKNKHLSDKDVIIKNKYITDKDVTDKNKHLLDKDVIDKNKHFIDKDVIDEEQFNKICVIDKNKFNKADIIDRSEHSSKETSEHLRKIKNAISENKVPKNKLRIKTIAASKNNAKIKLNIENQVLERQPSLLLHNKETNKCKAKKTKKKLNNENEDQKNQTFSKCSYLVQNLDFDCKHNAEPISNSLKVLLTTNYQTKKIYKSSDSNMLSSSSNLFKQQSLYKKIVAIRNLNYEEKSKKINKMHKKTRKGLLKFLRQVHSKNKKVFKMVFYLTRDFINKYKQISKLFNKI